MKIEVVLTESEIAQEFAESLEARDLPEKSFYWFPSSVRAWNALAHESGYYVDLNRAWKAAAAKLPALLDTFGNNAALVSYGCGDGIKDRSLIRTLADSGMTLKYFPVDASQ